MNEQKGGKYNEEELIDYVMEYSSDLSLCISILLLAIYNLHGTILKDLLHFNNTQ